MIYSETMREHGFFDQVLSDQGVIAFAKSEGLEDQLAAFQEDPYQLLHAALDDLIQTVKEDTSNGSLKPYNFN